MNQAITSPPHDAGAQRFRASDARKSNDLTEKIRVLLDGVPVAIAKSAVRSVLRDIDIQLSFNRTEF